MRMKPQRTPSLSSWPSRPPAGGLPLAFSFTLGQCSRLWKPVLGLRGTSPRPLVVAKPGDFAGGRQGFGGGRFPPKASGQAPPGWCGCAVGVISGRGAAPDDGKAAASELGRREPAPDHEMGGPGAQPRSAAANLTSSPAAVWEAPCLRGSAGV